MSESPKSWLPNPPKFGYGYYESALAVERAWKRRVNEIEAMKWKPSKPIEETWEEIPPTVKDPLDESFSAISKNDLVVVCCNECGAMLEAEDKERHFEWHRSL